MRVIITAIAALMLACAPIKRGHAQSSPYCPPATFATWNVVPTAGEWGLCLNSFVWTGGNGSGLTGITWSQIGSTPTTLAGYGITNGLSTALASGDILVGNGSGVATAVSMSGDGTLSNSGALTVSAIAGKVITLGGALTTTGGATTLAFPASGAPTFTYPSASDTLAGLTSTQTLSSKTLASPVISGTASGNGTIPVAMLSGYNPPLSGTTGSIGGSALAAGACTSGTVSVSSSTTSMAVVASPVTYPGDGIFWHGYVSAAGTVTVKVCASVALTPTSSAYNVRVIQ